MRSAMQALVAAFSFCVLPLGAAPVAVAAESKGVVRVGLLDPISGMYAPQGQEVDAGFRYYLATHDNALGGFRVELRTADEGGTPETALASAHQLIEEDAVDAIVGLVNSNDALGVADYLESRKKPLVITAAGVDELTQAASRKTFFRVAHTASQDAMPLGDYVCHRLKRKTAAIVAVAAPYGWESAGGFARAYTASGCRIVQETYVAPDATDWRPIVAKLDRNAEALFVSVSSVSAPALLGAIRASGPKATIVGTGAITDESVLGEEREAALGAVTTSHYTATLRGPRNTAFRLGYESLGGKPVSQLVENGYVAAAALATALEHVPGGTIRGEALAAGLHGAMLDAPRGPTRFDAYGQVVDAVYVRCVRQVGGRYRNDVVTTFPNVSQFWRYDPTRYLQLPSYEKLAGTWERP